MTSLRLDIVRNAHYDKSPDSPWDQYKEDSLVFGDCRG